MSSKVHTHSPHEYFISNKQPYKYTYVSASMRADTRPVS